jgi:Uma2 family endonuclease
MTRLHEALEYYDEYQRPVKGFFMTELDHNSNAPDRHPVLIYIQPTSLNAPKSDARLPPDWIGEVLEDPASISYLAKYARHGVAEYWRVWAPPEGELRLEVHTGVDRDAGAYTETRTYTGDETVASAAFPGLQLKPSDLRGQGPLVPPEPPPGAAS